MLKRIIYYYNKYEGIIASYRRENTDWEEKCNQLDILVKDVTDLETRHCKNLAFYSWLRLALIREIREEQIRVFHLAYDK
ncbi:MAG: hypothetical protein K2G55_12030 [Lachnospiraceae bacterium]|nr:hypothetical protein [Lachnospiraceae bacterium]MDE7202183.1 hypothetical protein [Lachnospiraceae bacterium]